MTNLKYMNYLGYWILGPWTVGVLLTLVSGLLRAVYLAQRFGNELHLHLLGTYIVTSRRMCLALLALSFLTLLGLLALLSKRIV